MLSNPRATLDETRRAANASRQVCHGDTLEHDNRRALVEVALLDLMLVCLDLVERVEKLEASCPVK